MNLNFGINPPQSKEAETLYQLAYRCVANHKTANCNACTNCAYNISRYGWDPNQVQLIKARALVDYQQNIANNKAKRKAYVKLEASLIIMSLFMLLLMFIGIEVLCTQERTVEETIALVKPNLRDANWDKQINCIDYAIVFYEFYPNSRIIHAYNRSTRYDHLLNKVGDRYVEPQVYNGDPLMLWPIEWPNAKRNDETDKWAWFATRRHW
jgi:hypothetical protein